MEKIIFVNKKRGEKSAQVVARFRKKYPGEKVGHAGTLDPLAEGLLILLVGKATKRQSEFMSLTKEYLVEVVFGVVTKTWDLEGEIKKFNSLKIKNLVSLNGDAIKKVLADFSGVFKQVVPLYSATHFKGKRLYRLARRGVVITEKKLPKKIVEIRRIELIKFVPAVVEKLQSNLNPETILKFGPKAIIKMRVGKGVYVRSVVYQLGKKLGLGATVIRLIRTKVGRFTVSLDTNEDHLQLEDRDRPFFQ